MAFFYPRTASHTEASFNPLFRILIDDFERKASRPRSFCGCAARRTPAATTSTRHWQPRFDIREVEDAYVLQGELPGLTKENVSVEFPEPSTLVIRGEVGKTTTAATPVAAPAPAPAAAAAAAEDDAASTHTVSSTHSTYQATVEDDEDDFEDLGSSEKQPPTPELPKAEIKSPEQPAASKAPESAAPAATAANPDKFWLRERRAGQFSRTFRFNSYINHEAATANLENGLLSIVVPKAKKPEARSVSIN